MKILRWLRAFLAPLLGRPPAPAWGACPWCGADLADQMYRDPYFRCTRSGVFGSHDIPTTHWFEGEQECPGCGHRWDVSDSD